MVRKSASTCAPLMYLQAVPVSLFAAMSAFTAIFSAAGKAFGVGKITKCKVRNPDAAFPMHAINGGATKQLRVTFMLALPPPLFARFPAPPSHQSLYELAALVVSARQALGNLREPEPLLQLQM